MSIPLDPMTPPRMQSTSSEFPDLGEDNEQQGPIEEDCSSPAVSWMLRVRSRNDELKRFFGLPATENLLDEFHCALRWRILLQGRVYVFDRYVCFYTNVFGYSKNKAIPLHDVVAVKKKTHFRFPNSIEFECENGSRYFFTSFLSRDEAYKLIVNAWNQCRESGNQSSPVSNPKSPTITEAMQRRAMSVDVAGLESSVMDDPGMPASSRMDRRVVFGGGSARMPDDTPRPRVLRHVNSEGAALRSKLSGDYLGDAKGNLVSEERGIEDDDLSDVDRDSATHEEDEFWGSCTTSPAPAPHKEAKVVLSAELPCTTKEFYSRFLCNNSHFFEDCHETAGDRRVILSSWRRDQQLGFVRDLSFVSPIKSAFANWGTSHTQCYQTQRLACYATNNLVLETSQTMTDIPYGDCFSVETYWQVVPGADDATCTLTAYARVNFSRKCLFKRVIDSGTHKQMYEFTAQLVATARNMLANPAADPLDTSQVLQSMQGLGSQSATPTDEAHQPGHQRSPSLDTQPILQVAATPTLGSFSASQQVEQDGKGRHAMFGVHPAVLLLLLAMLFLQVMMVVVWWRTPAAPLLQPSSPQQWLQRLAALQQETQMLQARMDLVAREAGFAMQQLQLHAPNPTG